jgi:hypothetical protein
VSESESRRAAAEVTLRAFVLAWLAAVEAETVPLTFSAVSFDRHTDEEVVVVVGRGARASSLRLLVEQAWNAPVNSGVWGEWPQRVRDLLSGPRSVD